MICGSQDGTARLVQLQAKRVLTTLAHDTTEAQSGTVDPGAATTENSVEW